MSNRKCERGLIQTETSYKIQFDILEILRKHKLKRTRKNEKTGSAEFNSSIMHNSKKPAFL